MKIKELRVEGRKMKKQERKITVKRIILRKIGSKATTDKCKVVPVL
jgi:hypothetical protein